MSAMKEGSSQAAPTKSYQVRVTSPNVEYTEQYIQSKFTYETTAVRVSTVANKQATPTPTQPGAPGVPSAPSTSEHITVVPVTQEYEFRTEVRPKKTGVMLVGIGGNNGTTLIGTVLANKLV